MPIVLRTYSPFPPGGFVYTQSYPGGSTTFKEDGLSIEQQSKRVLDFRRGNSLPGDNLPQVMLDISVFTCTRLGGLPAWCVDSNAPIQAQAQSSGGGCSTCGRPQNA